MLPATADGRAYPKLDVLVEALTSHSDDVLGDSGIRELVSRELHGRMSHEPNRYMAMSMLIQETQMPHRQDLKAAIFACIDGNEALRQAVWHPESAGGVTSSTASASIFPEPSVCEGREDMINEVVGLITKARSASMTQTIIVHGTGGIGKSTLALMVLRHMDIVSAFGDRRYFVRCDGLRDLAGLESQLVRCLGIALAGRRLQEAISTFFQAGPSSILVLDNFEDLCENGPSEALMDFVSHLASIASVLITKRGSANLLLPRKRTFVVGSLDPSAARRAFIAYGQQDLVDEEDPALSKLLEQLDGYALAIMLLGRAVEDDVGPAELLERYQDENSRAGLLHVDRGDSRATSLEISVRLSLQSRVMRDTPGALALCQLLAFLPDGAHRDLAGKSLSAIGLPNSPSATSRSSEALVRSGLASWLPQSKLLRMVAPLRRYFEASRTIVDPNDRDRVLASIRGYMTDLAQRSSRIFGAGEDSVKIRAAASAESRNMDDAISRALSADISKAEAVAAVQAALNASDFIRVTAVGSVPSFLESALSLARRRGWRSLEAECLRMAGDISSLNFRVEEGTALTRSALEIYQTLPDQTAREVDCLEILAKNALSKHDLTLARQHLDQALSNLRRIRGSDGAETSTEASCLSIMGDLELRGDDLAQAESCLVEALRIYTALNAPLGMANTLKGLGDLDLRHDRLSQARQRYSAALERFRELGEILGEGLCSKALGRVDYESHEYRSAGERFQTAVALFHKIGARRDEANTIRELGELAMMTSQQIIAQSRFEEALAILRKLDDEPRIATCLVRLGQSKRNQGAHAPAKQDLEEALTICQRIDLRIEEGNALEALGDLALEMGDPILAASRLREALDIFRDIDALSNQLATLTRLGSALAKQGKDQESRQVLQEAMAMADRLDSRHGRANTLLELAGLDMKSGRLRSAATSLGQATNDFKAVNQPAGAALAMKQMVPILIAANNLKAAEELASEASSMFRSIGFRTLEADCCALLGDAKAKQGDLVGGMSSVQEALALHHLEGDTLAVACTTHSLGNILAAAAKHGEARQKYQEAAVVFKDLGAIPQFLESAWNIADIALQEGDLKGAERWYADLGHAAKGIENLARVVVQANIGLARVACQRAQTQLARERLMEAAKIAELAHDETGIRDCQNELGRLERESPSHGCAPIM